MDMGSASSATSAVLAIAVAHTAVVRLFVVTAAVVATFFPFFRFDVKLSTQQKRNLVSYLTPKMCALE